MIKTLKYLICLAQYLMLMHKHLSLGSIDEIIPAVLAPTATATDGWYDISIFTHAYRITRQTVDNTNEVHHLLTDRIRKDYRLTSLYFIAVNPIHYHSVSFLQLRRKPTRGNREDSESVSADCPYKQQCQH